MFGRSIALGVRRLGQAAQEWRDRAMRAIVEYDRLLGLAARIPDERSRGEILAWIGRADVPGSPAERYTIVRQQAEAAETSGAEAVYSDELARRRVEQLENALSEFAYRISAAPAAPAGAVGATERDKMAMCVTGGIALLGLVVFPLFVLD